MLFPIKFRTLVEQDEKEITLHIDPECIVDVEAPVFNGGVLRGTSNIWQDGSSPGPIMVSLPIEEVAGWIECCYIEMRKKCPFMYIASNLYVNARYIAAIEPSLNKPEDTLVRISGSVIGITLHDRTAEEIAKQVNAVLEGANGS